MLCHVITLLQVFVRLLSTTPALSQTTELAHLGQLERQNPVGRVAQETWAGAPAEVLSMLLCQERADTGRTAAYSLPSALDALPACSKELCAGVSWPLYDWCSGTGAMSVLYISIAKAKIMHSTCPACRLQAGQHY